MATEHEKFWAAFIYSLTFLSTGCWHEDYCDPFFAESSFSFASHLTYVSLFCLAAGIVIEEKNWPPFLPLIHHDITNEIPSHLQRMQYFAFASFLGIRLLNLKLLKYFTRVKNILLYFTLQWTCILPIYSLRSALVSSNL
jgi:hypothetical protein